MRYAVAIVNYNGERFFKKQIRALKKYLLKEPEDTIDYLLVDNSKRNKSSKKLAEMCRVEDVIYIKLDYSEGDFSRHHALALNHIYNHFRKNFNKILFLDHDIFPFRDTEILKGDEDFKGLSQVKGDKSYLHPALMWINLDTQGEKEFDFMPDIGTDTGGKLSDVLKESSVTHLSLSYKHFYINGKEDFYEIIGDNWMHFVKGSNWIQNSGHNSRIEYLFKELKENENRATVNSNQ